MPELPDVQVYVERLDALFSGRSLEGVRQKGPFFLRTYQPPVSDLPGQRLRSVRRIGKRIVLGFDRCFAVLHLMIAGRLRVREPGESINKRLGLFAFDFENACLWVTEAGSRKRASLHLVSNEAELEGFSRGGLDVFSADLEAFSAALRRENRTLKRALTDPTILDGIGNAYSDEILFSARLSPVRLTHKLEDAELGRLFLACRATLSDWTERLRAEVGEGFPEKVTAFREGMAVHGRYRKPCVQCGGAVQRIRYAENECNYCPACQTGGRLLADRGLSRLLKGDWPKTLAELEERMGRG
jgi:formamidopyrimidine-DNA glycosylase